MLENLSEAAEDAAAEAKMVARKIIAAIGESFLIDGRECRSAASIGITVFGDHVEETHEVLQQADLAMYQAKAAGRHTVRFFAPHLQAAVNARAALEDEILHAIDAQQFALYYQPQVDRGRIIGGEALIRWNHPTRGVLSPAEFIPLAEETGLILPLGKWALEAAFTQIALWTRPKECRALTFAVNISARQFRQANFAQEVLAAIKHTGANPQNIDLELTESMMANNIEEMISKMTEIKSHGLRFSLDDFGTGYSSLAYLKRLPLDQLKIDRAFVREIPNDSTVCAIARAIVSLGHIMGLSVIAEGVENNEQLEYLARLGCHAFQGYLFSRPVPAEEFQKLLPRRGNKRIPHSA